MGSSETFNTDNDLGIKPRKWTKEHSSNVQVVIKQHYDQTDPLEKLENRLFAIKLEMQDYLQNEAITEIKTVGKFIQEAITAFKELLNISKKALAEHWEMTTANLSKYINKERGLNVELALKIASTLDIPAQLLLDIQIKNQLLELSNKKDYEKEFSLEELTRA
jgi:plasmid maintenance system antidote protein VapI